MVKQKIPGGRGTPPPLARPQPALLLPALLLLVLPVLAACSTRSHGVPVAGLSRSSAPGTSALSPYQRGLKYSACMRSHGIANFPDPALGSNGDPQFTLSKNSGIDPISAPFQSAQQACQPLMQAGQAGQVVQFDPAKIGAWTTCIRAHGVPTFTDPTNTGTGLTIDLSGTNIDQNTLQNAVQACRTKDPGGTLQVTGAGGAGG
jgi:hypothetical protein